MCSTAVRLCTGYEDDDELDALIGLEAPRYSTPRPPFDPTRYVVLSADEGPVRALVERGHYSRSYPAAVVRAGMYEVASRRLVGAAVFAVPMQRQAIPAWTGFPPEEGLELSRVYLEDDVGYNAETWLLARANKLVRALRPHVRVVVSYADPVARYDADGNVVKPEHRGTIYRALAGAMLVGRSSPRRHWIAPDGTYVSQRALSKIRLDERGRDGAVAQLVAYGAPSPDAHESGRDYVARALASGVFERVYHPGNHVFVWGLDKASRAALRAKWPQGAP